MKILVVQDYLRSGGTERQSVLLANAFAAAGQSTTLLTFRPGGALTSTVSAAVTLRALQPFDLGLDWFAPGLGTFVRQSAPDVALCMGRMANCLGQRIVSKASGAAVITTMRTGKPLPALFRRSLQRSRHIVANSSEARERLTRRHAIPADKVTVIRNSLVFPSGPNAIDADTRATLRAKHGASPTTTVLGCVAMFRPEKNQRELIEIVAGLPAHANWQLWLAGDGAARAVCEQLAAAKNLGDRIKFLGFESDPTPLYHAADVAVHASWSEALSNFLIEAQAHGVPYVAYEAQGIRECGLPEETGWTIARDDRTSFRAALMKRMEASAGERENVSRQAREFARAAFDPTRQVAAYLELFARLKR